MIKTWDELLALEMQKPYFQELIKFLKEEDQKKVIFPKKEDRLNCFRLTPLDRVKVVILGQDPYHDYNQAHGLCFSVLHEVHPKSLQNIFIELKNDLGIPYPKSGNLTPWAKQGVLLLNTILTVEAHKPLSHANHGWEIYTTEVIKLINNQDRPIVFILWGNQAKAMKQYLNNPKHLIIESVHPSPLSAHRGFFGSKPFSRTNDFLMSHSIPKVDWTII
jgi:uracil-DNA glycosylase